ncbi:hypothetical protein DPMN_132472 [Dreissena polymorpha]|uniref:Uncharacterized protein n=1 Tax=Dreissena polymorpha TaxID=45954 RepID=A0A9D4FSJ6_DREPO|nr:hypothetical protein DPMN_132472 [Dreissena polymorpha]
MPDGRLVTVYANKQCIVMNDKLVKIGKTYLLRTIPLGVVCMSDNEIAVTLDNKTVCVLVVDRDCVIREKRTFSTVVQYGSLRKLDAGTLVGFTRDIPEHARKFTMDGREEDFTTLTKRDYTSMCKYECMCLYIPSRNTFLTRDTENDEQLQIHDTDMGSSKPVQFDNKITALCQGPEDSVIVVCDKEVVQMTTNGVILWKCSGSGYEGSMVCIDKNFRKVATAGFSDINLCKFTI